MVISTLQVLNYTVPGKILWDRHFTDEETNTKKRLTELHKFTMLVNTNPELESQLALGSRFFTPSLTDY